MHRSPTHGQRFMMNPVSQDDTSITVATSIGIIQSPVRGRAAAWPKAKSNFWPSRSHVWHFRFRLQPLKSATRFSILLASGRRWPMRQTLSRGRAARRAAVNDGEPPLSKEAGAEWRVCNMSKGTAPSHITSDRGSSSSRYRMAILLSAFPMTGCEPTPTTTNFWRMFKARGLGWIV